MPPFSLYRALRRVNPAPFLYFLDFGGFSIAGSSPEILVRVREGTVTIRPAPLSASQSAALATAAREESPLPPHAIAALAERSGGNPLFLQELVSAAEGAGSVEALPDSIEGVLTALIDRLPAADRTMLRYASVLGATFDERLLNAVMALERNADDGVWRRLTAPAVNPEQALFVSEDLPQTKRVMIKDENICVHCGLCAERCPTAAWDMQRSDVLLPYAGKGICLTLTPA